MQPGQVGDAGTAYSFGPLKYDQSIVVQGHTLWVYNITDPTFSPQRQIAYNNSTKVWQSLSHPSTVVQTKTTPNVLAVPVVWKTGNPESVYFAFYSPFFIMTTTGASATPDTTTSDTTASGPPDIISQVIGNFGTDMWAGYVYQYTHTYQHLYFYRNQTEPVEVHDIAYNTLTFKWEDAGGSHPHTVVQEYGSIVTLGSPPDFPVLMTFTDPYY